MKTFQTYMPLQNGKKQCVSSFYFIDDDNTTAWLISNISFILQVIQTNGQFYDSFTQAATNKLLQKEDMRYPFQSSDKITKAMDSHIFPSRMKRYQIAGMARMGKKDII